MKKRLRSFILIILTVVIFTVPMLLVACDKDDDEENSYGEEYKLKYYYGEYMPLTKYFQVVFTLHGTYDSHVSYIIGVKENSYIYYTYYTQDASDTIFEYGEKELDENLLAEIDRKMEFMGDHVEFRKGEVYFCDSRQSLTFPPEELYPLASNYLYEQDKYNEYNNFALYLHRWDNGEVRELKVYLPTNTVQDKNGVEWDIQISRRYKKNDGE